MKVAIILTLIPAILAAAVAEPNANAEAFPEPVAEPGTLMKRVCPSSSVISSCWSECVRKKAATDKCYACCQKDCRPCWFYGP